MSEIKVSEILKFNDLIESIAVSKQLLDEKLQLRSVFEIGGSSFHGPDTFSFDCNENRIIVKMNLLIDDKNKKRIGQLKYYLKKSNKDSFWNRARKNHSRQEFTFTFDTYDEFLAFYEKYLV